MKDFKAISATIILCIGMLAVAGAISAASYSFTTLNDMSAGNIATQGTTVQGINSKRDIVGWYGDGRGQHGFLYKGGTYISLNDPNATQGTFANGINARGDIVGWYTNGSLPSLHNHGFLYHDGVYTTLDDPNGVKGTSVSGINDRGDVVGTYDDKSLHNHGFLYHNGAYATLDDPNGVKGTSVSGINDGGDVVGDYVDGGGIHHGFLYKGGTYITLNDPNAADARWGGTFASGVNNRGDVVGSYGDNCGQHGFLYKGGTYTTLDDPSGNRIAVETSATGINDHGTIVGWYNGYRKSLGIIGGCRLVMTPLASKLITLGTGLACFEMRRPGLTEDFGVAIPYAEPTRYVVAPEAFKESAAQISAMLLTGEAYAS